MRIVVWVPMLTFHQSHLLRELARLDSVKLHVVVGLEMIDKRAQQGWREADRSGLYITDLRSRKSPLLTGLNVLRKFDSAIHLFGGIWGDKYFPAFIGYAVISKIRFGLISEPFMDKRLGYLDDDRSLADILKDLARPLAYKAAGFILARFVGPIFAISRRCEEQFLKMKFPEEHIFPWGYFIPRRGSAEALSVDHRLRIVYVGTLIRRKGLDRLLRAVKGCERRNQISVDVYGPANRSQLRILEQEGGSYKGTIPFGEAQSVIGRYDLLVLPSRFDGWGVVVNEAILQGVPVLVDEMVGARCLVASSGAGAVLSFDNSDKVSMVLQELLTDRSLLHAWRANANDFRGLIEPKMAATYFRDCILSWLGERPRPECAWAEDGTSARSSG